ncbi:MAG: aspartate kinase [Nitrososphaerales archaeon]
MRLVFKFGGTSVDGGERIKHVANIISNYSKEHQIIAVISAMGDTTDLLIDMAEKAKRGKEKSVNEIFKKIEDRHLKALDTCINKIDLKKSIKEKVEVILQELNRVLMGIIQLRELTPRSKDYVLSFGERLSTLLVWGSLRDIGIDAEYFTGKDVGIVTDSNYGEAKPLMDATKHLVRERLEPILIKGSIPVVTGFIGADQDGVITTLGRGGSDYTATILGAALNADEVWLWTDVDGLMTADPRIVKSARTLDVISYLEAIEMAIFGAKGMHPRALEPVMEASIPVRVRNTFNLNNFGTLITKDVKIDSSRVVKAINLVRNVALINITGPSMVGGFGTAARIFEILARNGVNIMMISQSVSESSISIVIRKDMLNRAVNSLEVNLLGSGLVKEVTWEDNICAIAVIGSGMRGTPGVAARVFKAVASKGINVKMIAQGSSELSISFVVKDVDGDEAIRALHDEFKLAENI